MRDVVGQRDGELIEAVVVGGGVVDAAAGANHGLGAWGPGNPESRREVVAVGVRAAVRIATLAADKQGGLVGGQWSGGEDRLRRRDLAEIDAGELVVQVVHGRREFVADAEIQGQVAEQAEIVLRVVARGPLPAGEAFRPECARRLAGDSKEHGGDGAAGAVVGCGAAGVTGVEVERP